MEKLIPISRRQHDAINGTVAAIREQQTALQIAANAILLGIDEDLGQVGIVGARCFDGVYSLIVQVPDIAPAEATGQAESA